MIGRLHHVIMDCRDPMALATFYSELLGLPITYQSDDFVVVAANDTSSGLAFQLAPDHQPPVWPDPARPQQVHFDVMVEDVATSGARASWPSARRSSAAKASTRTRPVIRSVSSGGRGGLRRSHQRVADHFDLSEAFRLCL
jgi:catechol 2,3-dioxygenase-like lactoylglutathione lyase family enzyme